MKKIILAIAISIAPLTTVMANNLEAHQEFRGAAIEVDQENWYRELRFDSWITPTLTRNDIQGVLARIDDGEGLRDDTHGSFKGSWTYEFYHEAKNRALTATSYEALRDVSVLFMIASYPNLQSDFEIESLKLSVDYYVKAQAANASNVKHISYKGIEGLLHMPKGVVNPPVVLWTGGVDKTLVEHREALQGVLQSGSAVLTFDMMGGGLNVGTATTLGSETVAHDTMLEYVKTLDNVDSSNVSVLGSSGVGVALMEFAVKTPALKSVVARCAVVDGVLTKPFLFPKLPKMTTDSFGLRHGLNIDDLSSYGAKTVALSLKTKGYFNGEPSMDTPLLVINTSGDVVASPEDMQATASMSTHSKVVFVGESGHCPEGNSDDVITQFIIENQK